MSCCPDFTAMALEETKEFLASQYPEAVYKIIYYDSPKSRDEMESYTHRIIRQRMVSGNIEFTVSLFRDSK